MEFILMQNFKDLDYKVSEKAPVSSVFHEAPQADHYRDTAFLFYFYA